MSRVYFHTPSAEAELRGSERAYLGGLVDDIAIGLLGLSNSWAAERLAELVNPAETTLREVPEGFGYSEWRSRFETALHVGWRGALLQWRGQPIQLFALKLNTAAAVGGDVMKLAARLHGQCEIHAWVDGPNRAWLADIMQAGLDARIYRRETQGWEDVIKLLRSRDDEPVVTSYSGTERFPNQWVGDWMPPWPEGVPKRYDALTDEQKHERDERQDAWYEVDEAEQWRIGMAALRASSGGLEIKPDDWATFHFRHGLTVFDLLAADRDARLDAANLSSREDDE